MQRRAFLAAGSLALAGLAGCMGGDGTGTPGGSTTAPDDTATAPGEAETTPGDTTTTTAGSLSASVMMLQPGLLKLNSPDSSTVIAEEGTQYLFLEVSASGSPPDRSDLALRFDGASHAPQRVGASFPLFRTRNGTPYEGSSGWVLFELPESGDAGDAALTWPGGEWAVPEQTRRRLAEPLPTLTPTFDIPETLPTDREPTIEVEVTNEGSIPGTFVAAIDRSGPSVAHIPAAQIRTRVPAGETVTETISDSFYGSPGGDVAGDGEADITYYLTWAGGSDRREVRLVEPTTTTGQTSTSTS